MKRSLVFTCLALNSIFSALACGDDSQGEAILRSDAGDAGQGSGGNNTDAADAGVSTTATADGSANDTSTSVGMLTVEGETLTGDAGDRGADEAGVFDGDGATGSDAQANAGDGGDAIGTNVVETIGEPLPGDYAVALSADGRRLATGGATFRANSVVRVYELENEGWFQVGSDLEAEAPDDRVGSSVDLSADGARLAVGASGNDGADNDSGHARVFELVDNDWVQLGQDIDPVSRGGAGDAIALSAAGDRRRTQGQQRLRLRTGR